MRIHQKWRHSELHMANQYVLWVHGRCRASQHYISRFKDARRHREGVPIDNPEAPPMAHFVKAQETLGPLFVEHSELHRAFELCMNHKLTLEEFERSWMAMIEKHQVHDNETLTNLWDKRQFWVPAYFMQCFYPLLQPTAFSQLERCWASKCKGLQ